MMQLDRSLVARVVKQALEEDVGTGDVTTAAVVPTNAQLRASARARSKMVVAGLPVFEAVFATLSDSVRVEPCVADGTRVEPGAVLARVSGPAGPILTGERVALNFLQRLSGVATLTAAFVDAVRGTRATILDTRKTTPGLRALEKYAVRCGGGQNHRFGLFDAVLIKDNHLAVLRDARPNPIAAAVAATRAKHPNLKIEVEVDNLEQLEQAIAAGADVVLLDNMSVAELSAAVKLAAGRVKLEASGGVTLANVRAIAETGVDFISVGAITHSAPAVDIGLDFDAS